MGCDFYITTYIVVVLENNEKEYIELSKEPRYVFYYDSDEETYDEAIEREIKSSTKTNVIYENNKWLIKNTNKINYYKEMLKEYKFVKIEILKDGYERC